MRIDHYGEVLVGCIDCNRWGHPGDKKFVMEMLEDDLKALRERREKAFAALARASKADWGIGSQNESPGQGGSTGASPNQRGNRRKRSPQPT
jgi:hypothetical protein